MLIHSNLKQGGINHPVVVVWHLTLSRRLLKSKSIQFCCLFSLQTPNNYAQQTNVKTILKLLTFTSKLTQNRLLLVIHKHTENNSSFKEVSKRRPRQKSMKVTNKQVNLEKKSYQQYSEMQDHHQRDLLRQHQLQNKDPHKSEASILQIMLFACSVHSKSNILVPL